jgi:hypothetical protein
MRERCVPVLALRDEAGIACSRDVDELSPTVTLKL